MAARSEQTKAIQGLQVLFPTARENSENATLDIIAIPGLASNPAESFEYKPKEADKKKFNWLTDENALKLEFSSARVMLYHYDSRWRGAHAIQQSVSNAAENLLASLMGKRDGIKNRPIIFLAHSLGGLVMAKAIVIASTRPDEFQGLSPCFAGGIFFGTPFKGSAAQHRGLVFATSFDKEGVAVKSGALSILEPQNIALIELENDFMRAARKDEPMNLCCLFEQVPLNYGTEYGKIPFRLKALEEVVVTEESATLPGIDRNGMEVNHRELNRFPSVDDGRYEIVLTKLKHIVDQAQNVVRRRLKASRSALVDNWKWKDINSNLSVGNPSSKMNALAQSSDSSSKILDDQLIQNWINPASKPQSGHHLWISGPPGLGKTNVAASIIKRLEKLQRDRPVSKTNNIVIAYFFCEAAANLNTAENIIKSFLSQLISLNRDLAEYAKDYASSDDRKKGQQQGSGSQYSIANLWKTLWDILEDDWIGSAYFVVTNLHVLRKDSTGSKEFLDHIYDNVLGNEVQFGLRNIARVRWLFTSRHVERITRVLGNSHVHQIDLDDPKYGGVRQEDLKAYVRKQVAILAKRKQYSQALQYFASSFMQKKAKNMVWVDILCRKLELLPVSHAVIRKTLQDTSDDLSTLVDDTWSQVLNRKDDDVEWTKEILRALLLAYEDPTIRELKVLTEIVFDEKTAVVPASFIKQINKCGPFIKITHCEEGLEDEPEHSEAEHGDCKVAFLHPEMKTYLEDNKKGLLSLGEEETQWQNGVLSMRCFENILSSVTVPLELEDESDDDNQQPDQGGNVENPMNEVEEEEEDLASDEAADEASEECREKLRYSLDNWLIHARNATPDFAESLIFDKTFWQPSSEVRNQWWSEWVKINPYYDGLANMTALHIAAFFGVEALAKALLESGHKAELKVRDSLDNQPLHWAAANGHLAVVELLIESGADINDGVEDAVWTPLQMAAHTGKVNIMEYLFQSSKETVKIDPVADTLGTALITAIVYRQAEAVKLLLAHSADPNLGSKEGTSPLAFAALSGDEETVQLIIEAGGNKNIQSEDYGTALACASVSANPDIAHRIIHFDNSIDSCQKALDLAAESGSKEIVEMLLEHCPGLHCEDALMNAAKRGSDDILTRIWEYSNRRVEQNALDVALYTATDFELESTVRLLLSMNADANAEGEEYGDALTAAAFDGTIEIVKQLLQHNADTRHGPGYALQAAAYQGHLAVVNLLLEHNARVNAVSDKFCHGTALQAACISGSKEIAEILLKNNADPNLGRGEFSYPVIAAIRNDHPELVELLVEAKANTNVFGGPGNTTPLYHAAINLPVSTLKILIERGGADVNTVDVDGDTALMAASLVGDYQCVELLLQHGADFTASGGTNGSALHAAASRGFAKCCRLLLDCGADPTVIAGPFGTVIQAAAASGDAETIETILKSKNALDINVVGGTMGSALRAAAMQSDNRCIQLLLDAGADPNITNDERGTALQAAAYAACNWNVRILLARGADPNVLGGKFHTALQAAALKCEPKTIEALLKAGARIDVENRGKYLTPLAAAADPRDTDVLAILLKKKFSTGAFQHALATAARYNRRDTFQMIANSKGGKRIPPKVRVELKKALMTRSPDEDETNSDWGDGVIFNYQDPDDYETDMEKPLKPKVTKRRSNLVTESDQIEVSKPIGPLPHRSVSQSRHPQETHQATSAFRSSLGQSALESVEHSAAESGQYPKISEVLEQSSRARIGEIKESKRKSVFSKLGRAWKSFNSNDENDAQQKQQEQMDGPEDKVEEHEYQGIQAQQESEDEEHEDLESEVEQQEEEQEDQESEEEQHDEDEQRHETQEEVEDDGNMVEEEGSGRQTDDESDQE